MVNKCAQRLGVRSSEGQSVRSTGSGEARGCGMNDAEDVNKRIQSVGERPVKVRYCKRQRVKTSESK